MTSLDKFIGSLLSSIAEARRISDEQSIAIAKSYQNDFLLKRISIPRIRLPEVTMELPVLIEGSALALKPTEQIAQELAKKLSSIAVTEKITLPDAFITYFQNKALEQYSLLSQEVESGKELTVDLAANAAITALDSTITAYARTVRLDPTQANILRSKLSSGIESTAFQASDSSQLRINVLSSEILSHSNPDTVTRIKITVKEEGLEWSTIDTDNDGVLEEILIPE